MLFDAIIPAAGTGSRCAGTLPKQYQKCGSKRLLEHTLSIFDACEKIRFIWVVTRPDDENVLSCFTGKKCKQVVGGETRADSVLAGLKALLADASPATWAVVHDAARPLLQQSELDSLLTHAQTHQRSVILGLPVVNTLKKVLDGRVQETIDRSVLWEAQTPQVAPAGLLHDAISSALEQNFVLTDEASALECAGIPVDIIKGASTNFKITYPEDLQRAEGIMSVE
jgi:2-C-methyl-D-erythritol 4-phosphate cytidylyltransferase